MQRTCARLVAAIAAVMLVACSGGSADPTPIPEATARPPGAITVPAGGTLTIGVSAPLSGDQQQLGQDVADAAELGLRDAGASLKGFPVAIRPEDDGCADAEQAVRAAGRLIDVPTLAAVIGPMCTTGAQAADSVYEAAHVVHISPAATRVALSEQGEAFFFRMAWRDDVQAREQADFAVGTMHADTAAVVDDGEAYGVTLADAFEAAFLQAGGQVVSRQRIERGEVDFSSLAATVRNQDPDVVVFEGLNPEGALIVRRLREEQYAGSFLGPDGLLSLRDFIGAAGVNAEQAVITGGPSPDELFGQHYQEAFGRVPSTPFVLQAYDAVKVLLTALDAVAVVGADGALTIDRAALARQLHTQASIGLTGVIAFDERGDRKGDLPIEVGLAIYRVRESRFERVD
ncbi:MAG: branched-chain amino acid ABC transporter substrate-binding protein [Dehalococcoidia bacterium]